MVTQAETQINTAPSSIWQERPFGSLSPRELRGVLVSYESLPFLFGVFSVAPFRVLSAQGALGSDTIGRIFAALADEWHDATDILSSPTKKIVHPAYLRIISMGQAAIPYILQDLKQRGGDWYTALRAITGESPVPPEAQGDVEQMDYAWFEWGRWHGYAV